MRKNNKKELYKKPERTIIASLFKHTNGEINMNEIKLSTKVAEGQTSRLSMKMNTKDLGVNWEAGDIIRVFTNKKEGTLTLKRVEKKSKKTIAHTLTKTGGGSFGNDLGLYISHGVRRFKKDFNKVDSISAACRFVDAAKTKLEIYIPKEMYA